MMKQIIRIITFKGQLFTLSLAILLIAANSANAAENAETLVSQAEDLSNSLKPYYTDRLETSNGFEESTEFISLYKQATDILAKAERAVNRLPDPERKNYMNRLQLLNNDLLKAAQVLDVIKIGQQLERKQNELTRFVQSQTINNEADRVYTELSEMILKQERVTGKMYGKKYRQLALDKFVTPAKITKETIIFEVSIFRLQDDIKSKLYENNLQGVNELLAKLDRLEKRAIEIKEAGNKLHPGKYPNLPKANLHLSHVTVELKTRFERKSQNRPTVYNVTEAGNILNGGQFSEDRDSIYYVNTWVNQETPFNDSDQTGLYREKKDGGQQEHISKARFFDIQVTDHWIYYLGDTFPLQLFKVWKDGSETVQLTYEREAVDSFVIRDDWIYYETTSGSCSSLFKMRPDGSKKKTILNCTPPINQFTLIDNVIYVSEWNGSLFRLNTEGEEKTKITDNIYNFLIEDDWIYYIDIKRKALNKMKTDGSGHVLLTNNSAIYNYAVESFNIKGSSIYYTKRNPDTNTYDVIAIDKNGNNPQSIGNIGIHRTIPIINDHIYGHEAYNESPIVLPIRNS